MKPIHILLLPLLLLFACGKESIPLPMLPTEYQGIPRLEIGPNHPILYQDDTCTLAPAPGCNISCPEVWDDDLVYQVLFNPLDAREISYAYSPVPSSWLSLHTLNLETGEQDLVSEYFHRGGNWSVKDWIVFDRGVEGIWKAKSNGDSLTFLTKSSNPSEHFQQPKWDTSGTRIFVGHEGHYAKILDEQGSIIDSLPIAAGMGRSLSANFRYLAYTRDSVFGYLDFKTDIFTPIRTPLHWFKGFAWSPDNKKMILMGHTEDRTPFKILLIDLETREERILHTARCGNYYYKFPIISPDGQWLVMQKWRTELKDSATSTRWRDVMAAFINLETGEEFIGEFKP